MENELKKINIYLAKQYYLVPKDPFQLFYRSVIQAVNPYGYYLKLIGQVGHAYNRYYEWTPSENDNGKSYSLTLQVCDDNGVVLGSQSTTLIVNNPTKEKTKNILCVGDSLTANGYWVSRGATLYQNNGGADLNLLGTTSGGLQTTVKYEGHVGWQWSSYVNGFGDTLSPFQDPNTKQFSFINYCLRNGFLGIDELYILLTWNGIGGSFRTFNVNEEPLQSMKVFIDRFHQEYPLAKITLMGIPQPSVKAGLGAYYSLNQAYADNYGQFVTALNYNHQLELFCDREEYHSFIRFVDVKAQFDSEYNMPSSDKPVNNHSEIMEQVGTGMGMHPSTPGYLQIGDVFYRALSHHWN